MYKLRQLIFTGICVLLVNFDLSAFAARAAFGHEGLSLDDFIELTKTDSFEVRSKAEKVYRARHRINVAMGQILPNLNFGGVVDILQQDVFDSVPTLLGFMFPSNWFRWNESRLFYRAEQFSYQTLIGNAVNTVESLAYRISSINYLINAYQEYHEQLLFFINLAKERVASGEDTMEVVYEFETIRYQLQHDMMVLRASARTLLSDLATASAWQPSHEGEELQLLPIELPDLSEVDAYDYEEVVAESLEKSLEVTSNQLLIIAARYSRYDRMFSFLSPIGDTDGVFGFGYFSYIKIGKSFEQELRIKQEQIRSNIRFAARKAVDNLNGAVSMYQKNLQGLNHAMAWFDLLKAKYELGGIYKPREYMAVLDTLLGFQSRIIKAQHGYMIAKAQKNRLLWQGSYYQDLRDINLDKPPEDYTPEEGENRRSFSRLIKGFRRSRESKRIDDGQSAS
jgi:hypothetical protein